MKELIQFNPNKRITAKEALQHKYFSDIHSDSMVLAAYQPLCDEIENINEVGSNLIDNVIKEIMWYRNQDKYFQSLDTGDIDTDIEDNSNCTIDLIN